MWSRHFQQYGRCALDSTTIDLSLSLLPWAPYRSTKAAVKMHTLLDLRGYISGFVHISDGKLHDVNVLDQLISEASAFYVIDRGYIDFSAPVSTASGGQLLCDARQAQWMRNVAIRSPRTGPWV